MFDPCEVDDNVMTLRPQTNPPRDFWAKKQDAQKLTIFGHIFQFLSHHTLPHAARGGLQRC